MESLPQLHFSCSLPPARNSSKVLSGFHLVFISVHLSYCFIRIFSMYSHCVVFSFPVWSIFGQLVDYWGMCFVKCGSDLEVWGFVSVIEGSKVIMGSCGAIQFNAGLA